MKKYIHSYKAYDNKVNIKSIYTIKSEKKPDAKRSYP